MKKKNKRNVQVKKNDSSKNVKTLELDSPIEFETAVIKIGNRNGRFFTYSKEIIERVCENVNIMPHEIHSDSDYRGANGIIIGRTISAKIENDILVVKSRINKSAFENKEIEDFTICFVGIGKVVDGNIADYDFSCFVLALKSESGTYKKNKNEIFELL